MSELQAWREVRSKWATANIALVALETAILDFRWRYPKELPKGRDDLQGALMRLLRESREVGGITREVLDGILAEAEV